MELLCFFLIFNLTAEKAQDIEGNCRRAEEGLVSFVEKFTLFLLEDDKIDGLLSEDKLNTFDWVVIWIKLMDPLIIVSSYSLLDASMCCIE